MPVKGKWKTLDLIGNRGRDLPKMLGKKKKGIDVKSQTWTQKKGEFVKRYLPRRPNKPFKPGVRGKLE